LFASDEDIPLPKFKKSAEYVPSSSKPKKKKRAPKQRDEEPAKEYVRELSPESMKRMEANKDIDKLLKSIKSNSRSRRMDLGDEVEMDQQAQVLFDRMRDAAFADLESNKSQKPALHKLQMLPEVTLQLQKISWYSTFLEARILESMKLWYTNTNKARTATGRITAELRHPGINPQRFGKDANRDPPVHQSKPVSGNH
jgi:transcription factor SPN1